MSKMMADVCVDDRFELIAKYKAKLIEATNIETDKAEMDVIDNVLFRIWQMGWLDRLEQTEPLERRRGMRLIDANILEKEGWSLCRTYQQDKETMVYEVKAISEINTAQPELSDAYMKAVWTWLLNYQIKVAELKGRYTPYEVLSWVANDWRKEHE